MARYYVNNNPQPNGDHEVHEQGCYWLSIARDVKYLGLHSNCHSAVKEAKTYYSKANGCKICSSDCHTS